MFLWQYKVMVSMLWAGSRLSDSAVISIGQRDIKMLKKLKSRRVLEVEIVGFWLVVMLLVCTTEGLNSEGHYLLELKNSLHDEFNFLKSWKSTDRSMGCISSSKPTLTTISPTNNG